MSPLSGAAGTMLLRTTTLRTTTTLRSGTSLITGGALAAILLALLLLGDAPARAQGTDAPAANTTTDTTDTTDTTAAEAASLPPGHPNREPYRSERSTLEHVLAAPSYALHYATRPLGWAVKEAEERFPQVFEGNLPSYGAYPIFETGGESGFAGGAVLFYNDLPWGAAEHSAEARALVGSRVYNRLEGRYEVAGVFEGALGSRATRLEARAGHFNDPRERFYTGGNDADEDDRAFYALGQTDLQLEAATEWSERVDTEGIVRFERVDVDPGAAAVERDEGEERLAEDVPGVGPTNLASVEVAAAFDLTSQTERSVEGTRLRLGAEYAQRLGGSSEDEDFRFVRYRAEAVQFVPLPFLPPQRRLALRGFLEKAETLGASGRVPFYRLPSLGGTQHLRGYRSNRFREEGVLLLTAEYRWPVWGTLDALLLAEAGQVFADYRDLAPDRFHASYGGGFHLVTGGKLAFRFELAGSPEGVRTILTVQPAF